MKILFKQIVLLAGGLYLLASCGNNASTNGPITLGDSSAIVTEEDPAKLKDLVEELEPNIPVPQEEEPAEQQPEQKPADTLATTSIKPQEQTKPQPQTQPQPQLRQEAVQGVRADFKEVSVTIANIQAKQAGNRNLERANGAVYTWTAGDIKNSALRISGNITKVSQRYQTISVLKSAYGEIPIEALSFTTGWEQLNGSNGTYRITGLDEKSLEYADAGPAAIRNAVTRAAQRRRMSKKKVQEIAHSVRNVREANQKPFTVTLRSVMWKIDGKDANGRNFSKQIRMDIPL
jgi:hypothetical protein